MKAHRRKSRKSTSAKRKATRATLPKKIAAAVKAGDSHTAMDLAVFGRETTALAGLARDLYWLGKASRHPDCERACMTSGGERHGWEQPHRQSIQLRRQNFRRWKNYKLKELEAQIRVASALHGKTFLEDLERELNRVRDQDAKTILFEQFARVKSTANNPNWFRQMLIANLGLKQPHPLARLAKEIGLDAKTLRREVRKMGVKRGAAGRPKAG